MIIAWWHKEHPWCIELIEEESLPFKNANWIDYRPATKEELEMYEKGIYVYWIRKNGSMETYKEVK